MNSKFKRLLHKIGFNCKGKIMDSVKMPLLMLHVYAGERADLRLLADKLL